MSISRAERDVGWGIAQRAEDKEHRAWRIGQRAKRDVGWGIGSLRNL
ncbi:MAG: hypothetical protein V3R28_00555 [Desulfatiglandales bacterium]